MPSKTTAITDSNTILLQLYKRLLGKGNLITWLEDCFIRVGEESDWERTDYANLWSKVSVVQVEQKVVNVAKGWVYSFPHLSPFIEGFVTHSLALPIKEEIIARLNEELNRKLYKKFLPKNPEVRHLTKTDIEDLFSHYVQWYGVGVKRTGELVKVEGYNCKAKVIDIPKELQNMIQLEKDYSSQYSHIAGFYTVGDEKPGTQSFYKHPDTLEHLESWLIEKLQI